MNTTDPFLIDLPRMVSVDVETAGPNPANYALLSIGACTLPQPRQKFYAELQPDKSATDPRSMDVHHLDMQHLREHGVQPAASLRGFEDWLARSLPEGSPPLFLGFNSPFDWMFINDYFHRYLGRNPFGHSSLDVKSFFMGFRRVPWEQTRMAFITSKPLCHNSLEDALDQADLFLDILRQGGLLLDNI